ncbi:MAG: hypothetical protein NTX55_01415, partial [Candidatus Parcubacteria bacterium]|nr:hypothetical protein [Candidatus Parcubacteria bacterium]
RLHKKLQKGNGEMEHAECMAADIADICLLPVAAEVLGLTKKEQKDIKEEGQCQPIAAWRRSIIHSPHSV